MLGPSPRRWAGRAAALGAAAVLGLHTFVVQVSVVRGHSMEPCLRDGDRLVVERPGLMHEVGDFGRFDVVILGNPREPSVDYVKRVVGLPGDRVSLRDGQLHIDDHPVPEGFAPILDAETTGDVVVPAGYVWVLGDNRPVSADSRSFGLVPMELIRGRVCARIWPPARLTVF
ncbi:MAG: signal peptidase [Planctomycetota bacterium]